MAANIFSNYTIHVVRARSKIVFHRAQFFCSFFMWLGADLLIDLEIFLMVQLKGFFEMPHLAQDSAYFRSHF